jgi:glutamate dehydrogenase
LAKREAELLFREFRTLPGSLPDFSRRQSEAINRVTDAIAADFDERTGGDYSKYMYLVEEHMPEKLTQVAADRLLTRVPKEYIKRTIASALASKMVYQEGSPFVEPHTDEHLAKLSFEYLVAEQKIRQVEKALDLLDWKGDEEAQRITKQIVRIGGVKSLLV